MRKETKKARSNQPSTRALTAKQKRELAHLTSVRDDQIDTSEIPELPPPPGKMLSGADSIAQRSRLSPCASPHMGSRGGGGAAGAIRVGRTGLAAKAS